MKGADGKAMKVFRLGKAVFRVRPILITIVAFATLPPLIFAVVVLLRYADSERHRAEQGLMVSARGIARSIDGEFTTAVATLTALKNSVLLEEGNLAAFERRLRTIKLERWRSFALLDSSGKQIIDTTLPAGAPLEKMDLARLAPQGTARDIYISDVVKPADDQPPHVIVAIPIGPSEAPQWYLATFLYSRDFAHVIREPGVPESWIVSIVDRGGTHIRRSRLNDAYVGRPLVPELVQHMQAGKTGIARTASLEGIDLISTVAYAPTSGWGAAVGLPLAELEAPLWRSLRFLSYTGMAVALVALILAFFIARTLVSAVLKLKMSAQALGRDRIVETDPSSIREVNDVIETMKHVSRNLVERSKALNQLNSSLEALVTERTAELVAEMKRREESEAQLRQLQRIEAIGKLTGGIAHDFNNMLAVVMSGLNLTRWRLARGDTNVARFIEAALQGAENAAKLTERLLAFSRQQALSPEAVDCNKLIGGMSEILQRTIPESIEIETVLAGGLWHTFVDSGGLENAVLNLVLNARDAMPGGGKLTVETGNAQLDEAYAAAHAEVSPGQYVMVAITDAGTGIPGDILDQVFEPFFTTKEPGQGTGLGLSQVHGFIKQSGGHTKIYSEVGHGTTVKLYLPRLTRDIPVREVKTHSPEQIPLARNNETVLVVEDDAAVRSSTVAMLEELGYRVLEADSGADALDVLDAHPHIELLLTDVVMPGMNGRQLADEARTRRPDLRVLFTTGYTRNAIVHHGRLDADVRMIGKPFTIEALARKIEEALSSPPV